MPIKKVIRYDKNGNPHEYYYKIPEFQGEPIDKTSVTEQSQPDRINKKLASR